MVLSDVSRAERANDGVLADAWPRSEPNGGERFAALVQAIPDPLLGVVVDAAGALAVDYANPAWIAEFGFDPAGMPVDGAVAERLGLLLQDLGSVLAKGGSAERTVPVGERFFRVQTCLASASAASGARMLVLAREMAGAERRLGEHDHRVDQLAVLSDIGRVLAAKHSLDDLYRTLYREVGRVLQCDAFFVAAWDEPSGVMRFPLMYDSGIEYQEEPYAIDSGPTSIAIREARTVVWNGSSERPSHETALTWGDARRRSNAAIYAPMLSDGRALGVISVQRYEGEYSDQDVRLCEAVASHAAVAVSNAHLYDRLRSAEVQFRELISAIERMDEHCVVVTDRAGIVTYAAGTESTHGYASHELVGRHVNLLGRNVARSEQITDEFTRAALRGEPWTKIVMATHAGGRNFPIYISSSPYFGESDEVEGVVTIGRDLSHEVETQQRLLQSAKLASIGELVAGVAHELNNPLTVIKSTAHLLQDSLVGEEREDADMIVHSADRAVRIVRSLLHFARQTRPDKEETDLNEVVERVLRLRRDALTAAHIDVVRHLAPELPATLADASQIEQVVLNLVANAQLAMAEQGHGVLTVETAWVPGMLRLTVADTGVGIAPDDLPRVFDPFFTTRRLGEGTGLGLALSHGIVGEHGGAIWARSEPGAGATFVVELPLVEPGPGADGATMSATEARPGCRVLIVDDEDGVRRSTGAFLARCGYVVEEAASGEDALRKIEAGEFDAIMLDLRMPGMSGEEVFQQVASRWPALAERVIFATGDLVSGATRDFLTTTPNATVEKPYSLSDLAETLSRFVAR
jgi:PAS domain S-box-containing protein